MSVKHEFTFSVSNFVTIGLCNSSATSWLDIISLLTASPEVLALEAKNAFYDESSFLKIIGDAFRTEYVCPLSSHFTH